MATGGGISASVSDRFQHLSDEGLLGDGFQLQFQTGQWKIKRASLDADFQVFSIKVPSGSAMVDYLQLLAAEFKNDDEGNAAFKAKLLQTAAKTVQAFEQAQKWTGSCLATGTIKVGFSGKVRKSDFKATQVASVMGGLRKEAKAESSGVHEEKIRECANEIFGDYPISSPALSLEPSEGDEDEGAVDSPTAPPMSPHRFRRRSSADSFFSLDDPASPSISRRGIAGTDSDEEDEDEATDWLRSPTAPPARNRSPTGFSVASPGDEGELPPPPPPRAADEYGRVLSAIPEATLHRMTTALSEIPSCSVRQFTTAIAELNTYRQGHPSLDSVLPIVLSADSTTSLRDVMAIRFLVFLFRATTSAAAELVQKDLGEQDTWYRLQLSLIKTAYDLEDARGNTEAKAKLEPLLQRRANRQYPDIFYAGAKNNLKSRALFLNEARAILPLDALPAYIPNADFRQKLVENLRLQPETITL